MKHLQLDLIPKEWDRVVLTQDVTRYPHFIAPAGATGWVVSIDDDEVIVKLDLILDGSEEWDNSIHWSTDNGDLDEFLSEVAVLQTGAPVWVWQKRSDERQGRSGQ